MNFKGILALIVACKHFLSETVKAVPEDNPHSGILVSLRKILFCTLPKSAYLELSCAIEGDVKIVNFLHTMCLGTWCFGIEFPQPINYIIFKTRATARVF